jgi:hypothetical protein
VQRAARGVNSAPAAGRRRGRAVLAHDREAVLVGDRHRARVRPPHRRPGDHGRDALEHLALDRDPALRRRRRAKIAPPLRGRARIAEARRGGTVV